MVGRHVAPGADQNNHRVYHRGHHGAVRDVLRLLAYLRSFYGEPTLPHLCMFVIIFSRIPPQHVENHSVWSWAACPTLLLVVSAYKRNIL